MEGTRYGVEPFDVAYGAAFAVDDDSPMTVECRVLEDGGELRAHRPVPRTRPPLLAFVDGTMRTEARVTRSGPDGVIHPGLAGSVVVGAALSEGPSPLRVGLVTSERVVILCGAVPVSLPAQRGGWSWVADAVEGDDFLHARRRLQRRMRDLEGGLAETLASGGWWIIVDGPLHNVRRTRTLPIIGYVKTHHRRLLTADNWARVPRLAAGERSSIFAVKDDLYSCYLRIGDAGPWASPWAGIARLEVPSGAGRHAATDALDAAAAWLPRYASAAHRDPRAPVNLTPVAGLEAVLRSRAGDARLALRAVRDAIMQLNSAGAAT